MKKLLIFGFMSLLLLSCSDNSQESINAAYKRLISTEKSLYEMTTSSMLLYNNRNVNVLSPKAKEDYKNNFYKEREHSKLLLDSIENDIRKIREFKDRKDCVNDLVTIHGEFVKLRKMFEYLDVDIPIRYYEESSRIEKSAKQHRQEFKLKYVSYK